MRLIGSQNISCEYKFDAKCENEFSFAIDFEHFDQSKVKGNKMMKFLVFALLFAMALAQTREGIFGKTFVTKAAFPLHSFKTD